jgi:hypothetical protein
MGVFKDKRPNGPPHAITVVCEDSDNSEYILADGEETISGD